MAAGKESIDLDQFKQIEQVSFVAIISLSDTIIRRTEHVFTIGKQNQQQTRLQLTDFSSLIICGSIIQPGNVEETVNQANFDRRRTRLQHRWQAN